MPVVTAPSIPNGWLRLPGRVVVMLLGRIGYLGGMALLAASAIASLFRPRGRRPRLGPGVSRQLDELFGMGFPLVGLIHVGFGSFLSMQAYFGATFTQASGAVVGLGLIRNVAPMLTGFALAALMAVRTASDLGGELRPGLDEDDADVPDREVALGRAEEIRNPPDPARLTLVRLIAIAIAGPILTLWGATVGILIGALVSQGVLGVPLSIYLGLFRQMIRPADAVGVIVKGMVYPGVSTLIACHEALRSRSDPEGSRTRSAFHAVLLSIVSILF